MGLWTKEQLRAFIKENKLVTAQDAQNALKDLFAETIQERLNWTPSSAMKNMRLKPRQRQTAVTVKAKRRLLASMVNKRLGFHGIAWRSSSP